MNASWSTQTKNPAWLELPRSLPAVAAWAGTAEKVVVYWSNAGTTPIPKYLRQIGYSVCRLSAPTDGPDLGQNELQQVIAYVLDLVDAGQGADSSLDYSALARQLMERLSQTGLGTQLIVFVTDPGLLCQLASALDHADNNEALLGVFERPQTAVGLAFYLRLADQRKEERRSVSPSTEVLKCAFGDFVGNGPQARHLWSELLTAAASDDHVLIEGEPGTGKRLVAQLLHQLSSRTHGPFARIDCDEISSPRAEQQLFGFPGQEQSDSQFGWLERMKGGTLVLAHIDSLTLPLQRRIRRHLQAQSSPGGPTGTPRIVATSSRSLNQLAAQRRFDGPLLGLIGKRRLVVPALRQHPEDVIPLADRFLRRWSLLTGEPAKQLTADARQFLQTYAWPENVRELFFALETACATTSSATLSPALLQPWLKGSRESVAGESVSARQSAAPCSLSLEEMERRLIEATFARCGGNRERTARALRIGVRTLANKLREYGYPPHGAPGSNRRAA